MIKVCDKGYIWNPSNCECECDKACDVGEYLGYENCKCRKRLVDKLVDKCDENTDEEVKILDKNENKCSFRILYIVSINIINIVLYQYFLQLMMELLLLLFITNSWIRIKNMFLYMIMFIMWKIININGRK